MEGTLTIGFLIKRYIKMRGHTAKDVAIRLGMKYTTFCGILNRDVVDAKLLFRLANLLDMDLIWMAQLFDHSRSISPLAPLQMTRMQPEFRQQNYQTVLEQLDACIQNNPTSISDARIELLQIYPNLFYVLDMLLPENYTIRIITERRKEKLICISPASSPTLLHSRGRTLGQSYDGREMLNQIIAARKEALK
jgi:transcriptional regulator with XRE-family HTH domain